MVTPVIPALNFVLLEHSARTVHSNVNVRQMRTVIQSLGSVSVSQDMQVSIVPKDVLKDDMV